jgi:hypothetical protein
MRGTIHQARDYCCKDDGTRDPNGPPFEEAGECPIGAGAGRGSRSDCAAVVDFIKSGASILAIAEAHPAIALRCLGNITKLQSRIQSKRNFATEVRWYYGSTGSGKSRAAQEEAGVEAHWQPADNVWWDGYEGQANVVIDDYRPNFCPFSYLLRLFDRYPLTLQVKGATVQFVAKVIWVTSNKRPEEHWAGRGDEDVAQLLRRISLIKLFGPPPEPEGPMVAGFNPV